MSNTKQNKTNLERVKSVLEAAGAKGITLNSLIDEVNLVNGEKVPQDQYLARGPVMGALAEMPDAWTVEGDGDAAIYKIKVVDGADKPATSAELQTPDEMLAARVALVAKLNSGEHHAYKGTADQDALVKAGLAEVKTAEGGAQLLVLLEGAANRVFVAGAALHLRSTVPCVDLGEPREDAMVRRAKWLERIAGGEIIQTPAEFTRDMRDLIDKGVLMIKDLAEGKGGVFVLTEKALEQKPLIGFLGLAEQSLPPQPPPVTTTAVPVTATPEYKELQKQLAAAKAANEAQKFVERALRKELEGAVPALKAKTRFTYKRQWTRNASQPNSRYAIMGRGLELAQLLQKEIQRKKDIVDSAKARYDEVKKNLEPRIQELQNLGGLLSWDEVIDNCTAQIIGSWVYVRNEYNDTIAEFPVVSCPEYILTAAERVEEAPKADKKEEAKPAKDAASVDAKKPEPTENKSGDDGKGKSKKKRGEQLTIDDTKPKADESSPSGDVAADANDDASVEATAEKKQHIKLVLSVDGFKAAIGHLIDEHGYVFEDELQERIESACGTTIPESGKAFMFTAIEALKRDKAIKADRIDERSALLRVGEAKVNGKPVANTSGGKVGAAVVKKVLAAAKRLAGDKPNVTIKLQELVDASTCSKNEVELAMERAVSAGDAELKPGRAKAWVWKGGAK